ncbi:MAG: hypothetical protein AAGA92_06475 [Planctomycetota bacterium]
MKSTILCLLGCTPFLCVTWPTAASADTFTLAGFTFDDTLGPTNVVPAAPTTLEDYDSFAFNARFIPLSDQGNDFDTAKTVGVQLLGELEGQAPGGRSVPLGDFTFRGGLELNWGGSPGVTNNPGDDFVVYENGSPNGPEAYMIAVRETGASTFTTFRYEFADDFVEVFPSRLGIEGIAQVLSTGFDLSDFGLADGATIDAIWAANMLPEDRVDDALGQGNVMVGGGSGFEPLTGPQGEGGTYNTAGFDPDLTYIGVIAPSSTAGDFDADGDVDVADALEWQRETAAGEIADWEANFGFPPIPGDFDGDRDVGVSDVLEWQRNPATYDLAEWETNFLTPLVASTVAVPEPGAFLLACFGLSLRLSAGRRRE